jgi:hypothetical protein
MNSDWTYQGKPFTEEQIGSHVGFVYLITNHANGKKYVGKKLFEHSDNKRVWTKKGLADMKKLGIKKTDLKTVEDKKPYTKRKLGTTDSGWINYWGSASADDGALNKDIEKFGKDSFTREIIELVKYKGELGYAEVRHIVLHDAVRRPDYYNNNVKINCRGAHTITSTFTRSELYAKCREENPKFSETHGPQAVITDNSKEELDTWARQRLPREEQIRRLMED